jgi:TM2 domain-containing membrane protein YozV
MTYQTITSDKSKKKALKYCLFGGWFGLHHYYVGNIGKGLLYTCTLGLGLFGVIIDLIKIATGSFRDNAKAPLRQ